MAVTTDRYELPIAVCLNAEELARIYGISAHTVHCSITRGDSGKRRGAKFIKVRIEEGEEDGESGDFERSDT